MILIDNRQRVVPAPGARLRRAARRALAALGRAGGSVEITVVDDGAIRALNRAWRGIGRRTDVLALPLETEEAMGGLLGQVVISAETAARQASRLGVATAVELELLVTHGLLHLVGYDDRDPVEAQLMHARERAILGPGTPPRLWCGLLAR